MFDFNWTLIHKYYDGFAEDLVSAGVEEAMCKCRI